MNDQASPTHYKHPMADPKDDAKVPIPTGINKGLTAAKHATMVSIFGKPGALTEDCSPVTNATLKALMVKKNVGPFSVTGLKPAVEALERIFKKVAKDHPALHAKLRTDGMLCCRRVSQGAGEAAKQEFFQSLLGDRDRHQDRNQE
jgi:hypothetical protein